MAQPKVSIIVPTHNGKALLCACLDSVRALDYPRKSVETIVVDNASTDGTAGFLARRYPWVRVLRSKGNNYCRANNLGIRLSRGTYVAFLNNDAVVEPSWLTELVVALEREPWAAGVSGKILLSDGRINSAGHRHLPRFRVRDRGFGQKDRGQFDAPGEVPSVSFCASLFRRRPILEEGLLDEDFVLYHEDVDLCHRLRLRGWKILYEPRARARHRRGATAGRLGVGFFFNSRNRLLHIAKNFPAKLAAGIRESQFAEGRRKGRLAWLAAVMPCVLAKLLGSCPRPEARQIGDRAVAWVAAVLGPEAGPGLVRRWRVMLGDKKLRVGFYDHALHFMGGGQKYVMTMARALAGSFDVEYIGNRAVDRGALSRWHGVRVDFPIRIIQLPAFEGGAIDPERFRDPSRNPFDAVSRESSRYDIFVNANMLSRVRPRASLASVFVCHFPDQKKNRAWYVDEYDVILNNSAFTARWMERLWGLRPHMLLNPPIDMNGAVLPKEDIILSVARFEEGGSKRQREMVEAFARLCRSHPDMARRWRLVICGGAIPGNRYLKQVIAAHLQAGPDLPIEIKPNIGAAALRRLYASAKIFWHLCGVGQRNPALFEHFGMATAEAMQNGCVPVVFNGGGQPEIITHGKDGFLVDSIDGLVRTTARVADSPGLLRRVGAAARKRSLAFRAESFRERVRMLFDELKARCTDPPAPSIEAVAAGRIPASR
ncbi:MAG: glycosyltransferase [Elusimicrobiota bacterium]|jgi:GT2 family glycosyltransferase